MAFVWAESMSGGAWRVEVRLSALRMRWPQPYLHMLRMYFLALEHCCRPCAQTLRDETKHATSQQVGRGYRAELSARASACDGRTGTVLAQVIGEGEAELQRPAALRAASTALTFMDAGANQGGGLGVSPPLEHVHEHEHEHEHDHELEHEH